MIDVSIVIVNWNVKEYLRQCLRSVDKTKGSLAVETIVVDNASTDGSAEMVKSEFPGVRLIANDANRGFAEGNNQGFEQARGRYILILNPDTVVLEGCLQGAVQYLDGHADVAMVGCKILTAKGAVQIGCIRETPSVWAKFVEQFFLWRLFPWVAWFASPLNLNLDYSIVHEAPVIPGSFMFTRAEILKKLGGFDPKLFMYGDDTDLCVRYWRNEHRIIYLPWISIIHHAGKSAERAVSLASFEYFKAEDTFIQKYYGRSYLTLFRLIVLIGTVLRVFLSFASRLLAKSRPQLTEMRVVYLKVIRKTLAGMIDGRWFRHESYLN